MNDLGVDWRLGTIEMLDERRQAAFVEKLVLFLAPFVFDGDLDAAIEKRQLAQPLGKNIKTKIRRFKRFGCRA
jgi:hypothetical protein